MAKLQIGPFEVARGTLVPYEERGETTQHVDENEDGSLHIVDKLFTDRRLFRAKVKVTTAEAQNIYEYLTRGVRYKAITFPLRDPFGRTRTVRFWDRRVRLRYMGNSFVLMDLLFREEP